MKKLLLVVLVAMVGQMAAMAQDDEIRTILDVSDINTGYGGYGFKYTQIDGRHAYVNGGRGAWIINHNFAVGGGGYGFDSQSASDNVLDGVKYQYSGGYGGVLLEPILFPTRAVHLSFPVLIGAGGITYDRRSSMERFEDSQAFVLIEPGMELEFNLIKYVRLGVGVSYRYTSAIKLKYGSGGRIGSADMLRDFAVGIAFKFGRF